MVDAPEFDEVNDSCQFRDEIERLQQVVNTKDAAHAKDVQILEDMVHTQMMRTAELEATIESLRRMELQRTRGADTGSATSSPRPPCAPLIRKQELSLRIPLQEQSTAGTGDSPEARRHGEVPEQSSPNTALSGGTGEARTGNVDQRSDGEEDLTEMTARHNTELTKLLAELRQREQALRHIQAQTDASHVAEMSELQEQLASLTSRCAELEASLALERSKDAERNTELASLRGNIAQMSVVTDTKTQTIKQLEESVAVRNALMCNQARRIELREQEHRLQLTLLQAALFRLVAAEVNGRSQPLMALEEIVDTMKHSERDYHFQRVASEAAAAAARASGNSERVRMVELEASNAVLEAAARKMRERSGELARLEEKAVQVARGLHSRGRVVEGTEGPVMRSLSQGSSPFSPSERGDLTISTINTLNMPTSQRFCSLPNTGRRSKEASRSPCRSVPHREPRPRYLVAVVGDGSPPVPSPEDVASSSGIISGSWTPGRGDEKCLSHSPTTDSPTPMRPPPNAELMETSTASVLVPAPGFPSPAGGSQTSLGSAAGRQAPATTRSHGPPSGTVLPPTSGLRAGGSAGACPVATLPAGSCGNSSGVTSPLTTRSRPAVGASGVSPRLAARASSPSASMQLPCPVPRQQQEKTAAAGFGSPIVSLRPGVPGGPFKSGSCIISMSSSREAANKATAGPSSPATVCRAPARLPGPMPSSQSGVVPLKGASGQVPTGGSLGSPMKQPTLAQTARATAVMVGGEMQRLS